MSKHWDYFLDKLKSYEVVEENSDGLSVAVLAPCPSLLHGGGRGVDNNPSLRCVLTDDETILVKCRSGCSTPSVLKAMGLRFGDLYPKEEGTTVSQDDFNIRADVYESILSYLPLAPRHEKSLLQRGFTLEEIKQAQYKTFIKSEMEKLDAHLGEVFHREELARVPGFDEAGRLKRNEFQCGLLVPVRRPGKTHDKVARPYLLKTRRSFKPKYVVWTSDHLPTEPGFHWPLFNEGLEIKGLRITEGEFKADLAALRTGVLTVSMPGIDHSKGLLEFLNGFASSIPPAEITVAWDWADVVAKGNIRKALFLFLDYLSRHGFQPGIETWDFSPIAGTSKELKGLDDALAASRSVSRLPYIEARKTLIDLLGDPPTKGGVSGSLPAVEALLPGGVPPEFPLEVFPPAIREWVEYGAMLTNTPPDYIAASSLVVAGRCLGTKVKLCIQPDWEEQANFYMVIVAPPGSTKSPALSRVLKPLRELQAAEWEEYTEKRGAWEQLQQMAKASAKPGKATAALPPAPYRPYDYYVDDITIESLVNNLQANGFNPSRRDMATLVFRDELSAWVNSLNQYRKGEGADREFFLSGWSGSDVKVDRKSLEKGIVYLKNPFISVLGSTTPEVVDALETKGGKADGFFPRILCCMPQPKPAFRLSEAMISSPATHVWGVVLRRLLLWKENVVLHLTTGARQLLKTHYDSQADILDAGVDQDTQAMISKHRAYVLRLALVLHALNVAMDCSATGKLADATGHHPSLRPVVDFGLVEEKDVEGAVKLVKYFQGHYLAVRRHMQLGPEDRKISDFISWAALQGGRIEPSDLYRAVLFGCKGKQDAIKLFRAAEDRGKGIVEEVNGDVVFFSR